VFLEIKLEILSPQIDTIARCIERIESKKPVVLEDLKTDFDLQDVISFNLRRIIQASVNIAGMIISKTSSPAPLEMAESFETLKALKFIDEACCIRMKKSVGFRNLMVHEYEKIDWQIVFQITEKHLEDFKVYVRQISAKISP
jgi:uncharacterized protein YutE (UPF0331/DUF86 family)